MTWIFEVVFVFICIILAAVTNSKILAVIAAAIIFVSILNYVTQVIVHPRRIMKVRNLNSRYEISFNSDDFELKAPEGASKVNWSFFAKVWENEHYYFLFHNKRQYWIVPKESFRSAEQEQLFRNIVQSHHKIATGVIR